MKTKKFFGLFLAAVLLSAVLCAAFFTPLTASAAGANLAQGKRIYGADPTDGNAYTDKYNASLLDGIASDEFEPNAAPGDWFSYYYNQTLPSNAELTDQGVLGEFTIDLAAAASVESVRLHMFTSDVKKTSGIQPPHRIAVEYSADNASWSSFGERSDFSACNDIDWVEIEGASAVDAQYIKVSIYYAGPTLLLNEVQVIGEMKDGNTSALQADARFEVFDLTPVDADVDWYQDGIVVAIPNDGSEELSVASGDYQLRYVFILVYDQNGVCVEVGNNLLSADDERAAEFPQHDVKIPAGGFAVFFYYNANEGPSNLALYEYYEELGGTMYSNETGKATAGKNYTAEIENNTVTVYFTSDAPAAEPSAPEESSEASSEETEDPSAGTTTDTTTEPTESTTEGTTESTTEGTSEGSAEDPTNGVTGGTSDTDATQEEEGGPNTGVIVAVIIAVVVVIGGAVAALAVTKKKKG